MRVSPFPYRSELLSKFDYELEANWPAIRQLFEPRRWPVNAELRQISTNYGPCAFCYVIQARTATIEPMWRDLCYCDELIVVERNQLLDVVE